MFITLTIPDVKKSRFHKLCMNQGGGGEVLNKVLYWEALPQGTTPSTPLTLLNTTFDLEGSPSIHMG